MLREIESSFGARRVSRNDGELASSLPRIECR